VEIFFGIITRQAIRRGTFRSVKDLTAASAPSSTAGTTGARPSPGPRPQMTYSRIANQVKELRSHDTSFLASQLSETSEATTSWRKAASVFGLLGIIRWRAGTPEAVLEWFLNTVDDVDVQPGRVVVTGQASPELSQ
jgi:hypothetical protein